MRIVFLVSSVVLVASGASRAATEHPVYDFAGGAGGTGPMSGGVAAVDKDGRVFGSAGGGPKQRGLVFVATPPKKGAVAWTYQVIHKFSSNLTLGADSEGLTLGNRGTLYGVTEVGGTSVRKECGVLFQMKPRRNTGHYAYTVIYSFSGGERGYADGCQPSDTTMLRDSSGALYGITKFGGLGRGYGNGVLFQVTPQGEGNWTYKLLYEWKGGTDGANPGGAITMDTDGDIYGVTSYQDFDTPTAWEYVKATGKKLILANMITGVYPAGLVGPIVSPDGSTVSLLGFTLSGGDMNRCAGGQPKGCGSTFVLSRPVGGSSWSYSVLHNFKSSSKDGAFPTILVARGPGVFGATSEGGDSTNSQGTLFGLRQNPQTNRWEYSLRYSFLGTPDGSGPVSLTLEPDGKLVGLTTSGGTAGMGTIFEFAPDAAE